MVVAGAAVLGYFGVTELRNMPLDEGQQPPLWLVLRFLMTAFDGDGKSDLDVVKNLITMNDGIVDAELDDEGNRRGALTTKTRFLVIGIEHDENTPQRPRDERIRLLDEAKNLGIAKMALPELLRQMGWKNQTPVIRFGRGANPEDFRAQPDDGVPAVSSGTVSPLFEPRRPPAGARTMY